MSKFRILTVLSLICIGALLMSASVLWAKQDLTVGQQKTLANYPSPKLPVNVGPRLKHGGAYPSPTPAGEVRPMTGAKS